MSPLLAEVVHLHDVRVVEPRDGLGLAHEPHRVFLGGLIVVQVALEDGLDRDLAVQLGVHALVDDRPSRPCRARWSGRTGRVASVQWRPTRAPPIRNEASPSARFFGRFTTALYYLGEAGARQGQKSHSPAPEQRVYLRIQALVHLGRMRGRGLSMGTPCSRAFWYQRIEACSRAAPRCCPCRRSAPACAAQARSRLPRPPGTPSARPGRRPCVPGQVPPGSAASPAPGPLEAQRARPAGASALTAATGAAAAPAWRAALRTCRSASAGSIAATSSRLGMRQNRSHFRAG